MMIQKRALKNHKMASSYLGVDIGTTSIKIVEARAGRQKPQIVNYALLESSGYLARANQALQTSSLKIFESDMVELLKTARKEMGTQAKLAIASLPPFSAFTTVLDFPQMSPKEVEKAMIYQARQYVPLPLSEVALDWMKVAEYADENGLTHQKILLISVPREHIAKYQRMFKAAGLALQALEVESLSIARILEAIPPPPSWWTSGAAPRTWSSLTKGSSCGACRPILPRRP